jgi:Fe-Mn family superoxide dismutase
MSRKPSHDLITSVRKSLGLSQKSKSAMNEAYVIQAKKYKLPTEMLSLKSKAAHEEILESYVETLNTVSAQLDAVDRAASNSNHSDYRSLKIDEVYNLNAAFLSGLYFDNISDLRSTITMDSLTFMRLERDFGTFDDWQKDFIACAMASREGWAVTVYNMFLQRYINVPIDLSNVNVPLNCYPIIVLDMGSHSHYRDYLNDKKTYVFSMMKELNWETIEERVLRAERLAKVTKP